MKRMIARNGWVLGLAAILTIMLIFTRIIQPNFGASGLDSLARATLPFAFATVAMAIVVIAGGIDLSVASMMSVAGVTAAVLMDGAGTGFSVFAVFIVLGVGIQDLEIAQL